MGWLTTDRDERKNDDEYAAYIAISEDVPESS